MIYRSIRRELVLILCIVVISAAACAAPNPPKKLKIYVSVDMEGVVGAVTPDQLGPNGFEYQRFREFMTKETLAVVNGAKEMGATEFLVSDSHGNGENLLIEQFPKDVRIVRSWVRPLGMMAGIDSTFDAVIFIGYHASTSNPRGVLAHTFSSAHFTRVMLNGKEISEGAFNAAIAGHFGVPVVMISGDDAAVAEVRSQVGNIEGAETKKTLGFNSAITLTPEASYELIGQKVKVALGRLNDFKPYVVKTPVIFEVSFKNYRPVEMLTYLRMIQRVDSHTIRFVGKDMLEIADFVDFLDYSLDLAP